MNELFGRLNNQSRAAELRSEIRSWRRRTCSTTQECRGSLKEGRKKQILGQFGSKSMIFPHCCRENSRTAHYSNAAWNPVNETDHTSNQFPGFYPRGKFQHLFYCYLAIETQENNPSSWLETHFHKGNKNQAGNSTSEVCRDRV